ncbi:MAG TPA: dienelactone hydrolase family protein [Gemmatimonadaceae bacterium]|nr:dienelactone hydrolase family protein [Gemmatimonadaceae bacterium]
MSTPRRCPISARACTTALLFLLAACGGGDSGPSGPPNGPAGTLDVLFASPTPAELASVTDDWDTRTFPAVDVHVDATENVTVGTTPETVRTISDLVGTTRHSGLVLAPDGAADGTLPVIVYAHAGFLGVSRDELVTFASRFPDPSQFVFVAPSFATTVEERHLWDEDVDVSLAFLASALQEEPEADGTRVGVIGFTEGATMALLMAERSTAISRVVEFSGMTNFFTSTIRGEFTQLLSGQQPAFFISAVLNAAFVLPLQGGELTAEQTRLRLIRSSPALFVDRLPLVQIHHGANDDVVPVDQATSLVGALTRAGRTSPDDFQALIDLSGGHDPANLEGSLDAAVAFLGELAE